MVEERNDSCCPMMDVVRDHFPVVPIVVPLLFPILPAICLIVYMNRIVTSLEQIEGQLSEILSTVRRIG